MTGHGRIGQLRRRDTQIDWQSDRLEKAYKHHYLYYMDNDTVLEMKAETMQIALTFSCYHDDQLPELGGKSPERSAEGRGRTRGVCVLLLQFAKSLMYLLSTDNTLKTTQLKN